MLADVDIERALRVGELVVDPLRLPIQPSSVDLRLGSQLRLSRPVRRVVDPTIRNDDLWTTIELDDGGTYRMDPGEFALGHTMERIQLSRNLAAYIDGRSTLARNGLSIHVTAGFVDPGFEGQITLELQNIAPWPVLLRDGMSVGQLVLYRMSTAVRNPYGSREVGSKYQGQEGATLARGDDPTQA